jgi:hypothetical protein
MIRIAPFRHDFSACVAAAEQSDNAVLHSAKPLVSLPHSPSHLPFHFPFPSSLPSKHPVQRSRLARWLPVGGRPFPFPERKRVVAEKSQHQAERGQNHEKENG